MDDPPTLGISSERIYTQIYILNYVLLPWSINRILAYRSNFSLNSQLPMVVIEDKIKSFNFHNSCRSYV